MNEEQEPCEHEFGCPHCCDEFCVGQSLKCVGMSIFDFIQEGK